MISKKQTNQKIIWFKDKKLVAGFILILLSYILDFYVKALVVIKFYKPIYLLTGLFLWAISWILFLLGGFLVGFGVVRMIQKHIYYYVNKTVKKPIVKLKNYVKNHRL